MHLACFILAEEKKRYKINVSVRVAEAWASASSWGV
jgi:hypothetical protein